MWGYIKPAVPYMARPHGNGLDTPLHILRKRAFVYCQAAAGTVQAAADTEQKPFLKALQKRS